MEECYEPKCVRPATKKWEGRPVCADHYDEFREEIEKVRRDMY